jgi:hypothetical protein
MMCSGVSVTFGTRDDGLRPEVVRAWGPAVTADGSLLTLSVPAPSGSATRSNLDANGETAVLFVSPLDYQALQVKGRAVSLAEPTPEQLGLIEEHVLAFARNARHLGVDLSQIRAFVQPGHVAVTVLVREMYDQTPGRDAGRSL